MNALKPREARISENRIQSVLEGCHTMRLHCQRELNSAFAKRAEGHGEYKRRDQGVARQFNKQVCVFNF